MRTPRRASRGRTASRMFAPDYLVEGARRQARAAAAGWIVLCSMILVACAADVDLSQTGIVIVMVAAIVRYRRLDTLLSHDDRRLN